MTPLERLRVRVGDLGAPLCLGIDPHPEQLPDGVSRDVAGVETFVMGLIQAVGPGVAAVKLNTAFYEALGADGWALLARARRAVGEIGALCIVDAKRGDVGSSAERYAAALLGGLEADAVTLSPYLGEDAIEPFLAVPDRLIYVLARTSNPSAARFQRLVSGGEPLHEAVARWVTSTWPGGRVGLVVGATAADELRRLREAVPGPAFLVPGVGAQGGDLEAAARFCAGEWAPGLVAVSRAIAGASRGDDWRAAAVAAADRLRSALREAVLHSSTVAAVTSHQGGS